MEKQFIKLDLENIEQEHLCCAIADKKHHQGVTTKKDWLKERIKEGHVFYKANVQGKVFIEYAPIETAWVPIIGENYLYIYCLWVAGSYKGNGYGKDLLEYCIQDAKQQGKDGICVLSSKKKKPYLTDKKFMLKYGFKVIATIDDEYELLALSFHDQSPQFIIPTNSEKLKSDELTIYYGMQCPYIPNCIEQIKKYCEANAVTVNLIAVDTLEKAKALPCIFNNWAVYYHGKFHSLHLLNEGALKKLLQE